MVVKHQHRQRRPPEAVEGYIFIPCARATSETCRRLGYELSVTRELATTDQRLIHQTPPSSVFFDLSSNICSVVFSVRLGVNSRVCKVKARSSRRRLKLLWATIDSISSS
jgi:hypothetical protein